VSDSTDVFMTLFWTPRNAIELSAQADTLSDPRSSEPYWTRSRLLSEVRPAEHSRNEVIGWLSEHGIEPVALSRVSAQAIYLRSSLDAFGRAFGPRAMRWLSNQKTERPRRINWQIPPRLAGYVQSIQVLRETEKTGSWLKGNQFVTSSGAEAHGLSQGCGSMPVGLAGMDPQTLGTIYDFPRAIEGGRIRGTAAQSARADDAPTAHVDGTVPDDLVLDGTGETIALLLLDAAPNVEDCRAFWAAHGIERADPEVVFIGPTPTRKPDKMEVKEAAMGVQWAGAMAPGARIVCYVMDRLVIADKWSTFLMELVRDRAHAPTIAATAWLTPERNYYASYGSRVITGLLDQCTLLGVTVVAASGNWGVYDGVPRTIIGGVNVPDAPWPRTVFPACEERVLGVGGTMVTNLSPLTELAWSGPLPPNWSDNNSGHISRMAGGGGFSAEVPVPDYQLKLNSGGDFTMQPYPRGPHEPPVLPYGRGVPDVAMMAVGDAVQRSAGEKPTARGFRAVVDGKWIDFAGGTSVGAPIWAALLARINQARRAYGLRRVGFVNPLLYEVSEDSAGKTAFRDIVAGRTDMTMKTVRWNGHYYVDVRVELPGFEAKDKWDPATGLGVPRGAGLCRALVAKGITAAKKAADDDGSETP